MTARRAVILTLAAVLLVVVLILGGFLAYRGYDRYNRAQDRAKHAETKARRAEASANAARSESSRGYNNGLIEGLKEAIVTAGLSTPGWYVVQVARGPSPGVQPGDILVQSGMAPCKTYWFDPSDGSVWSRNEKNC
jgi:hypothetical protein